MRILREDCTAVVIDVQEKLFRVMDGGEAMLDRMKILLEGMQLLDIPCILTEQYPRGLGETLAPVRAALGADAPVQKMVFSCCDEPGFISSLEKTGRKTLIVCGIEAHVCVLQTVVDLCQTGYRPVVVADCIASRFSRDMEVALDRMKAEGATVTTTESLLFELLRQAGTDSFRAISRLIK